MSISNMMIPMLPTKKRFYLKISMYIRDIGTKINGVEKENRCGKMDLYMRATGKII